MTLEGAAEGALEVHPSAWVDEGAAIGKGTRIWHFCHVCAGARIGDNCSLGQNCFVASGAMLGDRVRLQNNVSVYSGVTLGDDVFCGPSVVFTNVDTPRAEFRTGGIYETTRVQRGATLGANCTIRCGVTLGSYCFVAAAALVVRDIPDFALVKGVPARVSGWVSRRGAQLHFASNDSAVCPKSGERYRRSGMKVNLCQ